MPVPFLTHSLGVDALIAVEVAWGANLAALASSWTWTDITTDVRIGDGINLKHGRADEQENASPASCSFALDNQAGAYSLGGQSPNWPNVKASTPIRVRIDPDDGGGYRTVFQGYVDTWRPEWDQSAKVATVKLNASGVLRRIDQFAAPSLSPLRRRLSTETNVVAYWPLDEGPKSQTAFSAFEGFPDLQLAFGAVEFGADTQSFDATPQVAKMKNGYLRGIVPAYTHTGKSQVRMLMGFPDNGTGLVNGGVLFRIWFDSASLDRVDVLWNTGGALSIAGYKPSGAGSGTQVITSGPTAFAANGKDVRMFCEFTQNGTAIDWRVGMQTPASTSGLFTNGTLAASTSGRVTRVDITPDSNADGLLVGGLVVQNDVTSIFDDLRELAAFANEPASTRMARLAAENGIALIMFGDGTSATSITDNLGIQRQATLLQLIREVQQVDGGMIFDGIDQGLRFWMRRAIENQAVDMTVDVAAAKLGGTLSPVDDDQDRVNRALVTKRNGPTAIYEDTTGPLGVSAVGAYETSLTIPVFNDYAPAHYAGWLVNLGTYEGYRYPSVELDFAATPSLVGAWLNITPGEYIRLTNVGTLLGAQHPAGDLHLLVQGYSQTITPYSWTAELNCTPMSPWIVGRLVESNGAATTGVDDAHSWRLEADGSTLATAKAAGSTSFSVTVPAGKPLWTTNSQDMPLLIDVGGIVVTVTAISGTSSPQTFTVTGSTVTKALAAGLSVNVHDPRFPGL